MSGCRRYRTGLFPSSHRCEECGRTNREHPPAPLPDGPPAGTRASSRRCRRYRPTHRDALRAVCPECGELGRDHPPVRSFWNFGASREQRERAQGWDRAPWPVEVECSHEGCELLRPVNAYCTCPEGRRRAQEDAKAIRAAGFPRVRGQERPPGHSWIADLFAQSRTEPPRRIEGQRLEQIIVDEVAGLPSPPCTDLSVARDESTGRVVIEGLSELGRRLAGQIVTRAKYRSADSPVPPRPEVSYHVTQQPITARPTWDRPDADPLADIRAMIRVFEEATGETVTSVSGVPGTEEHQERVNRMLADRLRCGPCRTSRCGDCRAAWATERCSCACREGLEDGESLHGPGCDGLLNCTCEPAPEPTTRALTLPELDALTDQVRRQRDEVQAAQLEAYRELLLSQTPLAPLFHREDVERATTTDEPTGVVLMPSGRRPGRATPAQRARSRAADAVERRLERSADVLDGPAPLAPPSAAWERDADGDWIARLNGRWLAVERGDEDGHWTWRVFTVTSDGETDHHVADGCEPNESLAKESAALAAVSA